MNRFVDKPTPISLTNYLSNFLLKQLYTLGCNNFFLNSIHRKVATAMNEQEDPADILINQNKI